MSGKLLQSRISKLEKSQLFKRVGKVIGYRAGDPVPDHDPEIDMVVEHAYVHFDGNIYDRHGQFVRRAKDVTNVRDLTDEEKLELEAMRENPEQN